MNYNFISYQPTAEERAREKELAAKYKSENGLDHDEFFEYIGTINRYSLLDRMRCDCGYYLGNGNRCNKYLWGGSPEKHIKYMKYLWNEFKTEDKPEWLTLAEIEDLEKQMVA